MNRSAARALFILVILLSSLLYASPQKRPAPEGCPFPIVTLVTPNNGPTTGGTNVTIEGTNFNAPGTITVTFGGVAATNVVVTNADELTATTPAHAAGNVDVVVTSSVCGSGTLPNGFLYLAAAAVPALSPFALAALAVALLVIAFVLLKR